MSVDDQKRKAFWNDNEEDEEDLRKPTEVTSPSYRKKPESPEVLDQKINLARTKMEQTNQLLIQYIMGTEKRVPIDKMKELEVLMKDLDRAQESGTTAMKFKLSTFLNQYRSIKDLWEKKLKAKESK